MKLKKIKFMLVTMTAVIAFLSCPGLAAQASYKSISAKEFKAEIEKNSKNTVILDIRTPQEYESGHLKGSRNIDFYADDFRTKLDSLDKTKKYLVYCRSGNRSSQALNMMKKLGFKYVIDLKNGIIDWQRNNYPLEK
ncbi:MAG: rhodanese-like domain-containing protein [Elusimicrobia bacterium]|nr:rhodanese-like domain-containing protein [Candidatus Liberimonas magnetica]